MKLQSGFAILDVKRGRKALREACRKTLAIPCSKRDKMAIRIPIVIKGFIIGEHGNDDGVSQEFTVGVSHVKVGPLDGCCWTAPR